MKVRVLSMLAVCAVGWIGMGATPSYSLGTPTAPILRVTTDAAENEWLGSNAVYAVASCLSVTTNGENAVSKVEIVDQSRVMLAGCEAGFSMERVKPEVYLGEVLTAPADVDWAATYEAYEASGEERAAFIFDAKSQKVYAQAGGTHEFTWVLAGGEEQTKNYVIAPVASGRPYRMFWTDSPYNAPAVNMSGRFIKLFGPDAIVKPTYGDQVTDQNGMQVTNHNVIVKGVFLDESSSCLYARGEVSGQFIVAFYDSGSFDTLQRVQVVEVGRPDVNYMTGYIGEKIEPYGTGYETSGLTPSPVTVASASTTGDTSGAYYYQHQGTYSYSPKHNWIFPLRPTVGEAWRLDVYWMETDAHGVTWPFERCNYSCTWNTNKMATLIAGAPVKLPDSYEVSLCSYQEPEGHARAPESKIFKTQAEGFSMLKVKASDNVWFIPVRTIARENENFFTLTNAPWYVGDEVRPRGGSVRGTVGDYIPKIDSDVSGLLNLEESGNNYNPNLYYDWTTTSNELDSVIYGVNETGDGKPLEVFWSTTVQQDGMEEKIAFPSLVQRYRIVWPKTTQVPQIVLASQLGGAGQSRYETGSGAYFDGAAANLTLPNVNMFHSTGGSVAFWVKALNLQAGGHVLTLGAEEDSPFRVDVEAELAAEGVSYTLTLDGKKMTTPVMSKSAWHKIVFTFASSNLTAYVDGKTVATAAVERASYNGYLAGNSLGGGSAAADGLIIDNFAVWSRTFDEQEASNNVYTVLSDLADDELRTLAFAFTFENNDLEPTFGAVARVATELKSQKTYDAAKILHSVPGAPVSGDGVFESDTTPIVYRQPTKGQTGYNPNEEHAFVASGAGGYYAWALRCDLNEESTSKPFVLVQYEKDGRARMKCFSVLLTNDLYTALAANIEAGHMLSGPHPIDLLDNPWCPSVYWDEVTNQNYSSAYTDRKSQVWARAAGTIPIHMYYRNQDGFDYPQLATAPAVGTEIPWLAELDEEPSSSLLTDKPVLWTWNVTWPSGVPTMRIGQTLTTAANNLPEVWSAKSISVLWPQGDDGARVKLWDPTVARRTGLSGYDTVAALLAKFGFSVDAGNVSLRAGKYTFKDLPPSIGERFYVDNTQPVTNCVTYVGELESKATGDILWPNVANVEEIEALKNLLPTEATVAQKAEWYQLIDSLGITKPILPTTVRGEHVPVSTYIPRDHYALTAMGDAGYVTIIENDAPAGSGVGQLGVNESDAISMHVFAVTNKYYTGRLVAREDPVNLLSQQLTILYTESFAGTADDYEFEWKKAKPTASGQMPKDYTNAYTRVYSDSDMVGRTRFTLGTQGDTLANLVNTYYVMRYRAIKGAAKTTMGDTWSDWCGPTLAEGWIQRVVNNVTPYTQRMTDLYENAAETTATMIQAAGAPYTGDVALNQDNLTSVGLIQLYQTLLNKAESMSIASGSGTGINDADVNKQLLLATERLADMYTVLGNDAYSDALNPTIGFGTSSDTASAITSYGAATSELFCFDNQVSTLLDEELALLRGRTGENNPSVETSPFYNRLIWNYTRGITAGEVAYTVNYNINSSNGDAKLDEEDAAKQYPQGHGDAWGHYLSALSSYYRLLRNPYFTWPVSQMQMLVSDAVVDVDYYDEQRFAEIANKLATTAEEVTTRTALKAWRDNGGANSAGYLDDDTERNFGYGEWATRGAIAGVANWMVANAILPEAESSEVYYRLLFDEGTSLGCTNIPISVESAAETGWTLEFQLSAPTNTQHLGQGPVFMLLGNPSEDGLSVGVPETITDDTVGLTGYLAINVTDDEDKGIIVAYNFLNYVLPVTNMVDVVYTNEAGQIVTEQAESVEYERRIKEMPDTITSAEVPLPSGSLIAIHRAKSGLMDVRVLDANGVELERVDLNGNLRFASPTTATFGGYSFKGFISEIRGWVGSRATEDLQCERAYVNPRDSDLLFYVRGISSRMTDLMLEDITPGLDTQWDISNPNWVSATGTGIDVKFADEGLVRIDRTTVTELTKIPTSVESIQRTIDRLDAGLNPLGISDDAIPFDISSSGVAEGTSTHFEQVAARAETALLNAAKLLDRAQAASSYLRRLQNTAAQEEAEAQQNELDYESQLIAIYGTPFSGDIGPGKMYEQGYTGPDYYHYMYMDLSGYGLTDLNDFKAKYAITYSSGSDKWSYSSMEEFAQNNSKHSASNALVFTVSANGIVAVDAASLGSRSSYGEIQDAYSDYLLAYVDARNALGAYNKMVDVVSTAYSQIESVYSDESSSFDANQALHSFQLINATANINLNNAANVLDLAMRTSRSANAIAVNSTPAVLGVGLTAVFSPQSAVKALVSNANVALQSGIGASMITVKGIQELIAYNEKIVQFAANIRNDYLTWHKAKYTAWNNLYNYVSQLNSAAHTLLTAMSKLNSLTADFDTIIAKGDRLQKERELIRSQRVNRLTKTRYNDMLFRNLRDAALSRYSTAFETAQRQVFLAAQVYDYETGLLKADQSSGESFKAEIIGARALGNVDLSTGKPSLGSGNGDAGLADILARLESNYAVLKGRLGINNAQANTTSFSLRRDLFEIDTTAAGDADWKKELSKYLVDDLLSNSEFARYCQSFASTSGLNTQEPALVIPFSSTIDFGKNFFGKTLKAGSAALPSSYYATKIRSAAVKFENYNKHLTTSAADALASTPSVYLVPVGIDRMRTPGDDTDTVLNFSVVDQVIPVPYAIGSTELDKVDFSTLSSGYVGTGEVSSRIRRFPAFRAQTGDAASDASRATTRLIGRSAWNTRWLLIIPAGDMLGGSVEDRQKALDIFINGLDSNNDGTLDVSPVTDIILTLDTYSNSGN